MEFLDDRGAVPELNIFHPAEENLPKSAALRQLLAYWQERRGAREMPARGDLDPVDMKFILGRLVLFDVLHGDGAGVPRRFRFRLAGVEYAERFGIEPTGLMLDEYPRINSRGYIHATLALTVDGRRPLTGCRQAIDTQHMRFYDTLYMPLSTDGTTVDMVLVGFHFF